MRFLEKITPPFLKKLDKYLLLNHPNLWSTQIHHLLFWAVAMNGLTIFSGFWFPVSENDVPNSEQVSVFTVIPILIAFLFWVYKISLHKAEAQFGQISTIMQHRNVLIYLFGIALLFSGPIIFDIALQKKISTLVLPNELVKDINLLNTGQALLSPLPEKNEYLYSQNWVEADFLEDTRYAQEILSKEQVLKWIEKNIKSESEKAEYLKTFERTVNKYSSTHFDLNEESNPELDMSEYHYIPDDYKIQRNIHRIVNAHNLRSLSGYNYEFPALWGLFISWLGLIMIVFLRTDLRTTIISGITGFVIVLCSVFVSEISHYSVREEILQFFYFLSLVGALFLAFSKRNTVHFNLIRKVALSLLTVFTPFAFVMYFGDHGGKVASLMMGYSGILTAYLAWFLLFNRRMMTLISQPKQE